MADDLGERNPWQAVLDQLRPKLESDEFRRWFESTAYASDAGDLITVWTLSEAVRRHLATHYEEAIRSALNELGRTGTMVRFVVSGFDEEEDSE